MMGFFLVIIGILFLFKNFGFISGDVWDILWPALLIIMGINIIIRRNFANFSLASLENFFGKGKKDKKRKESKKKKKSSS